MTMTPSSDGGDPMPPQVTQAACIGRGHGSSGRGGSIGTGAALVAGQLAVTVSAWRDRRVSQTQGKSPASGRGGSSQPQCHPQLGGLAAGVSFALFFRS